MSLPISLEQLISEFSKFPSIGRKSAKRMAFSLLKNPHAAEDLSKCIEKALAQVEFCPTCFAVAEKDSCIFCYSHRDQRQICVVQEAENIFSVESSNIYNGLYHSLQGVISPMRGVTPDKIRIKELKQRVINSNIEEIILAMNPTLEGEATAHYIHDLLHEHVSRITRLATGIPMGADIEYSDTHTLTEAFENRLRF